MKINLKPTPRPAASSNPVPHIMAGLIIVAVMFGGLGTWAALAPLSGAIVAPGLVTVYSKRKTVQHLEGGIVAEILVRDGDYVEIGQPLIRLEKTRAQANVSIVEGRLDQLLARKTRLMAERDGRDRVVFPASLTAREDEPDMTEILRGEAELFAARRNALEGEVDILMQRIEQLNEQIRGLSAQKKSKSQQIALIREELTGLRKLLEKGFARKPDILSLERQAEELKGDQGEFVAEIARAKSGIGEAKLNIIQLQKKIRQEVVAELREVQGEIFDLDERRIAATDELERIDIRAPQAGLVVGMDVHTPGGVLSPGQTILDIVPGNDELVIEARVPPNNIDKVAMGLSSIVRFPAFDRNATPDLDGEVFKVSADRLTDDKTRETYYLVSIRIPDPELAKLNDLELVQGMPAEVFIATGERTALSYLLKPLTDGFARAFKDG